jgi:hypothetical protein
VTSIKKLIHILDYTDADPYLQGVSNPDGSGINWWNNQNVGVVCLLFLRTSLISAAKNFFRSVRNFVIDVTRVPPSVAATGIHWQVGQATSLINIDFKMSAAAGTKHQGCVCFSSQRCGME